MTKEEIAAVEYARMVAHEKTGYFVALAAIAPLLGLPIEPLRSLIYL
jgi:hypothetical protein